METETNNGSESIVDKAKAQIDSRKTKEGREAIKDKAKAGLAATMIATKGKFNAISRTTRLAKVCQFFVNCISLLQLVLESRFPRLRTMQLGRHAAYATMLFGIVLFIMLAFWVGGKSNEGVRISVAGQEINLSKIESPEDVYDAIWDSFYSMDFRRKVFKVNAGTSSFKQGEQLSDTPNKSSNKRYLSFRGISLSIVNDIYNEWKSAAHLLLQKIAAPEESAVACCRMAGRYFFLDKKAANALEKWTKKKLDHAETKSRLVFCVEAVDSNGKVVAQRYSPLSDFYHKALNSSDSYMLVGIKPFPLGGRLCEAVSSSMDVKRFKYWELGRLIDFANQQQASFMKKTKQNGEEFMLEEIYGYQTIMPLAECPFPLRKSSKSVNESRFMVFSMDDYVVSSITSGGVIARSEKDDSANPIVFMETPRSFKVGDKLSEVAAKFVSSGSEAGKDIAHLRHVLWKVTPFKYPSMEQIRKLFALSMTVTEADELMTLGGNIFDLSPESADSIVEIKCHIEEAAAFSQKDRNRIVLTESCRSRIFSAIDAFEKSSKRRPYNLSELVSAKLLKEADIVDAWGNPFVYRSFVWVRPDGSEHVSSNVVSAGPDGKICTQDDNY